MISEDKENSGIDKKDAPSNNAETGKENNGHGNDNNGNDPKGDKKISITVIVSGTATTIEANPKQKMQVIAQKALEQTGNTGRPLSDWTLKTRDGAILDLNKTVEDYGLVDGAQLVMSLAAGVGGQK
ncbi:DUF2604 domain-containing protein [Mucilaginibacter sabulilitoris]|uniref:DUF2604 domain-containing protein n=1 Tax=Mucilaginibacter sabulilitoris TaxID=1173583 RepID=A0ABZ0TPP9_9SPHI|nr:DUF2604 domain-containing protein [Mucilaginibacter sabulilitoris]WPU94756.1 DUF2604 domain-containing protein [Mucilaginibacter sabulilitoris]